MGVHLGGDRHSTHSPPGLDRAGCPIQPFLGAGCTGFPGIASDDGDELKSCSEAAQEAVLEDGGPQGLPRGTTLRLLGKS